MKIRVLKSGERVIVDPTLTVQRIYMVKPSFDSQSCRTLKSKQIFYLCINLGCLSPVATTAMEQNIGFWPAYLLCLCVFAIGITILIAGERLYVVHPPQGSIITNAFRAMWIGLRNGGNMGQSIAAASSAPVLFVANNVAEAAKPSYQDERGRKYKTPWSDIYVDELKRGLSACRVFLFYPIYWVSFSQMFNNMVSQGRDNLKSLRRSTGHC